ncbi:succinyl-diaminopimelate desuccinylase [Usitatibacter palustris]|uniref:Succinyl-diaminopimelate desuccinylase n=1 Tax=Usitatibacter palustris TaxID=2732487 RepID=A0A6M4H640_9PROT|nr:succinyl-diaminopimelate desuccinylase [Usitatibacter palustris]QJR14123.1 Succinyl-diaminopimelate desuccinylase [Usitatibacter palustris]
MKNETLELAKALIARKSVTPADEGCQQLLIDRLTPLGFKPEVFACGDVTNLWIRRGTAKPLVVLAGHTDVVPPGPLEKWHSDPFVPTVREGKLYGRGTADMKASIAAFVVACERFVAAHPSHPGSVALLITSDEEGVAVDGTVRVVEALKARGETLDYCIVGEPSSTQVFGDTIRRGRRGTLTGRLVVHGVQGHVAYPHNVKNPVHLAAPAIAEMAATEWDRGNEFFPPTSFQVSNIHAGTGAQNITPGHMQVDFNFRFSTESTPDSLKARVQQVLERHGLEFDLAWTLGGKPFLTERGRLIDVLAGVVKQVSGVTPKVDCAGGTSDGRFIFDICPQVAEFGPVNRSIHKVNEAVALDELEPLTEVYRLALEGLLIAK